MGDEGLTVIPVVRDEFRHDSYLKAIINLFIAPTRLFASIAAKPRWMGPFILCILTAFVFEATTNRYRMAEIKEGLRNDQSISAEEAQRRIENIDSQAMHGIQIREVGLGLAILTVVHAVKLFGMAICIWMALQLYPVKIKFMSILSLVSFAFLVLLPETIIKIPLVLTRETAKIYLGPAIFLPMEWDGSILFKLCDKLNIFNVWMAILLMTGLPIITSISRGKAILTVGYLWFIWLIVATVFGNSIRIN